VASLAIEPLPEQALGRKRPRPSSYAGFSRLGVLATVEIQLMLRCLDVRSRLRAARCGKQLYAAASHPFAWPPEHMATLRVSNDAASPHALVQWIHGSLVRMASSIHLRISVPTVLRAPLYPAIFAVPVVRAITVQPPSISQPAVSEVLLPLLLHPLAQQLRSLDVSRLWHYCLSRAELQQLLTCPHLHSLSFGRPADRGFSETLDQLALLPSLTHLSFQMASSGYRCLCAPLSRCARLTSLQLVDATINQHLLCGLADLPHLQCLQLQGGEVELVLQAQTDRERSRQSKRFWGTIGTTRTTMRYVAPTLPLFPALRLLRWRCRAPEHVPLQPAPSYPRAPVRPSMAQCLQHLLSTTEAAQVQVELVLPSTFAHWRRQSINSVNQDVLDHQHREWDELQRLPAFLTRAHIVEVEPEDDE
jgi:hypothetical protein